MDQDCVFCNIVAKQNHAEIFYEDDQFLVFKDILPKAPIHALVIPKEHIDSLTSVKPDHSEMMGQMVLLAKQQAESLGISHSGYKLVMNVGKDGGQVVKHIHIHLLGGKNLSE